MTKNLGVRLEKIERLDNGKGVIAIIVENGKVITAQSLYTPIEDDTPENYEKDNSRLWGELVNSFFALRSLGSNKTSSANT